MAHVSVVADGSQAQGCSWKNLKWLVPHSAGLLSSVRGGRDKNLLGLFIRGPKLGCNNLINPCGVGLGSSAS